jgi:hypothetical protein
LKRLGCPPRDSNPYMLIQRSNMLLFGRVLWHSCVRSKSLETLTGGGFRNLREPP